MRRFTRIRLSTQDAKKLRREQTKANTKNAAGTLEVETEWKRARRNQPLQSAVTTLKNMAGPRERCMYCGDSHGTDIEHFWPKAAYPERMFRWTNMLLGCTDCGRIKGDKFPLAAGQPLLVKPTNDDPWDFLDFDPVTGNIVARFYPGPGSTTPKGEETVNVLHLDRREALARGYQKAYRRICAAIEQVLPEDAPDIPTLIQKLTDADEYGILGWCFRGMGINETPSADLHQRHPIAWAACEVAFLRY